MTHTTTKQIKSAFEQYNNSTNYCLEHCYNDFSFAKQKAWEYCRELELKYNGHSLKVIGFNSMSFSAGFIGYIDNKEVFIYITKSYDRYIFIDEI